MPRLIQATEAQKRERDLLTHTAWGERLDLDAWLRREQALRSHPWASTQMQSWVLTEGGNPLASCESFRMEGWWQGLERSVYGIASVFTEPALRGRGHASRMLDALHEALLQQDPDALGTLLFSEVGPRLYERQGYRRIETQVRILPAGDAAPRVEWVQEDELPRALAMMPRPPDLSVWPTAPQLDWHLERQRFYAEALRRQVPSGVGPHGETWVGAKAGGGAALWAADFRNERLVVLVGSAPNAEVGDRLLAAAAHAAAAAGLREVHVWESPGLPATVGDLRPLDDLPMFRPFAPGLPCPAVIPRALWV